MASEGSRPATVPAISIPPAAPASAAATSAPPTRLLLPYLQSSLFLAFRRCWLLASTLGLLVGAGVGTLWWFAIPEHYSAEIRVRIAAPWMTSAASSAGEEEIASFQRTQTALIQSTTVLEEVLRRPEAARLPLIQQEHDPLAWLGNHLVVGASPIPDILLIRVASMRADEAATLAQTIAEVYLATAANHRQNALRRLKAVRGRTEESLRKKRQRLTRLENSRLVAAKEECLHARVVLRIAREDWEKAEKQQPPNAETVSVSEQDILARLNNDPDSQLLFRKIDSLEEDIKKIFRVSALKENDPHLPELYRKRDETRKKLGVRREEIQSILKQQAHLREIQKYEELLTRRRDYVDSRERVVKSFEDEVRSLGGAAAAEELKTLREEVAASDEMLRKLAADQERL
ncbi:MAG: hypothetical protein ACRELF_08375, partial [Gemmataceae bacterium]